MTEKVGVRTFINHVLDGAAQGVILGLIANSVLAAALGYFDHLRVAQMIIQCAAILQLATPLIIGTLIAQKFELPMMESLVVGGAAFVGSGVVQFDPELGAYIGAGTGDIFSIMVTASIAIVFVQLLGDRLGSSAIIGLPILVGVGAGFIGMVLFPYISQITASVGYVINSFTNLHPLWMSILLACSFAILIISPLTTVGIGMAIGLNGLSAGAAAMGVAATTLVLMINSRKVNEPGVIVAIGLGGMKIMMPNLFRTPIILLPCLFTATISGVLAAAFHVTGTPQSAGFGLVGMVGPLAAIDDGMSVLMMLLIWFVIPIVSALLGQFIFERVFNLYERQFVFKYHG